jgi:LmbE family N-acetylglucosaminyl deacetylase
MHTLRLGEIQKVLCLGAHGDDIEIGCGGTMLRLVREIEGVSVRWVVLGARGVRAREASATARKLLGSARGKDVIVRDFPDGRFPNHWDGIKTAIHEMGEEFSPDLIFAPRLEDRHQDHRLVAELTWTVFRDHWILEYEIPKYEGDLAAPNFYVPLSAEICREKIRSVMDGFPSQNEKPWFTEETFRALLRLRGVECNSPSGYAEGFTCRKMRI